MVVAAAIIGAIWSCPLRRRETWVWGKGPPPPPPPPAGGGGARPAGGRAAGQAGANIMNTALGQGLQATGQAIAQAPTTAASLAIPGAITSAVGDVQQAQNQQVLNANNQAAWFQQMLPLLKGQELTAGAAGLPGGETISTGNQVNNANPVSQAIGLVAALGGLTGGVGKLMRG